MLFNKILRTYEADGASTGAGATPPATPQASNDGDTKPAAQDANTQTSTQADTDKELQAKAQKIADAMLAKKMKDMPTKEELKGYQEYVESKKTEAERLADAQAKLLAKEKEAEEKNTRAEVMMLAMGMGVQSEYLTDAIILATALKKDEQTLEESLKAVVEKNKTWVTNKTVPGGGGNPASNEDKPKPEVPMIW